jgi:PAS domain-containing protein
MPVGRNEAAGRKKYDFPTVTPFTIVKLPTKARVEVAKLVSEITSGGRNLPSASAKIRFELSLEGKFTRVSEKFCELVGFPESKLIGREIDGLTASGILRIPQHLGVVVQFGYFRCLWMFVHGDGHGVLVRTDWALLPDMSMEVHCVPLFA